MIRQFKKRLRDNYFLVNHKYFLRLYSLLIKTLTPCLKLKFKRIL